MKTRFWLPMAAALLSSAAIAQTTNSPANTAPVAPAPAAPAQPAPPMSQPMQPATPPSTATAPAPTTRDPATTASVDANAPLAGANSFTEAQAKARIEEKGFASVTALAKDNDGIWRGKAMQGDKQVDVALDFRGNVVSR